LAPKHWEEFIGKNEWRKLHLEQLGRKELQMERKRWILIMELLVKQLSIQKLDLFMGSIVELTQRNYKVGWNKFIDFILSSNESFHREEG
jgi:hypothetical protein